MSTARKLGLAAALLIASQLLSRLLGFGRDAFIAGYFGANGPTDAFYAAFTIPDWLNYVLAGGALSVTFIPIYSRYLVDGDSAEGDRVFSIATTVMGFVVVAGIVLLEFITPPLLRWYLPGMAPANFALAVHLTRVLLPAQFFFYLGGLASATLFSRHRFLAASSAPLIYNSGTILGGVLFGRVLGISSLAWGTLAGAMVGPFLVQQIAATRAGLRFRPSLRILHPGFREWVRTSLPLMVGITVVYADDWIIRHFAASDVGAISWLNYARKLVQVPIAIAGQAVAQASMPFFARLYVEKKQAELGDLVKKSARAAASVAALCGGAIFALAEPLVDLLFRRGHFAFSSVAPTAQYLAIFAIAIPLWAMQGIVARAFYAAGDTLTPMLCGTFVTITSIPIYYGAYHAFGVPGLVVASGITITLHNTALLIFLPRRLAACDRLGIIVGVGRAVVLAALAALPTWLAAHYLPIGHLQGHLLDLFRLATGGAVFLAVTLIFMRPLGVEDAAMLFDKLVSRLRR